MPRKMDRSPNSTSFRTPGTRETPQANRSPAMASQRPRRLLSFSQFRASYGKSRYNRIAANYAIRRSLPLNKLTRERIREKVSVDAARQPSNLVLVSVDGVSAGDGTTNGGLSLTD